MDACPFITKIDAYHDGELNDAEARGLEAHLPACAMCLDELRAVRIMSKLMLTHLPPRAEISTDAMRRLHDEVQGVMERSLLRLASGFTAIAAAVLVVATAGLMSLPPPSVAEPQAWESSAFAMQASDSSGGGQSAGSNSTTAGSSLSPIEPDLIVADLSRADFSSRKAIP
jgi:anti-sigma factor RsiW